MTQLFTDGSSSRTHALASLLAKIHKTNLGTGCCVQIENSACGHRINDERQLCSETCTMVYFGPSRSGGLARAGTAAGRRMMVGRVLRMACKLHYKSSNSEFRANFSALR